MGRSGRSRRTSGTLKRDVRMNWRSFGTVAEDEEAKEEDWPEIGTYLASFLIFCSCRVAAWEIIRGGSAFGSVEVRDLANWDAVSNRVW